MFYLVYLASIVFAIYSIVYLVSRLFFSKYASGQIAWFSILGIGLFIFMTLFGFILDLLIEPSDFFPNMIIHLPTTAERILNNHPHLWVIFFLPFVGAYDFSVMVFCLLRDYYTIPMGIAHIIWAIIFLLWIDVGLKASALRDPAKVFKTY